MITFSTVGDTERCAPSTFGLTVGGRSTGQIHPLIDKRDGDDVELGFLYQGSTFAPLNWKEVWNSQLVGEVAVNAVFAGSRSFVPGSGTPLSTGTNYSTGFLRCANGDLALRPDTLGCMVESITETSAFFFVAYAHYVSFYKAGTTRHKLSIAAMAVIAGTAKRDGKTVWIWKSRTGFGVDSSKFGPNKYSSLSEVVAEHCGVVREWWDAYKSSVRKMEFSDAAAKWISMSVSSNPVDRNMIISYLMHNHKLLMQHMRDAEREEIPSLHARSFDQVEKFEGNFLVLLSKLDSFGQVTFKSIKDLMASAGTPKDFASFWLANRYGDKLSISGVADLIKAIDKEFLTIRTKTERFVRGNSRVTIPFSDGMFNAVFTFGTNIAVTPRDYNGLMKLIRTAYEWDFYPSLANVWDAIPLSFVVDWFGNVGDIFASVDRMVQSHYYDVACILQSARAEASDPFVQGVNHIYYERRIEHSLQLGVESFKLGLPSFINLIDGAALLCG